MTRRVTLPALLAAASLYTAPGVSAQQITLAPAGLEVFNRTATSLQDGSRTGIRLSASAGEGVAFLGVDGTTSDAVYFRPFNFKAADPARHAHAVQYVSHPTYTWDKLRAEQPGKYEQPVSTAPDPNGWFHVRVVIAAPQVKVFVNEAKEPSLVVTQLSDRRKGRVGLWVGNNSAGDFANLTIVAQP